MKGQRVFDKGIPLTGGPFVLMLQWTRTAMPKTGLVVGLASVESRRMLALSEVKASFELRREEQVAEATKMGNKWQQGRGDVGRCSKMLEENTMEEGIPANSRGSEEHLRCLQVL